MRIFSSDVALGEEAMDRAKRTNSSNDKKKIHKTPTRRKRTQTKALSALLEGCGGSTIILIEYINFCINSAILQPPANCPERTLKVEETVVFVFVAIRKKKVDTKQNFLGGKVASC
jgi:hypothetical protein